MSYNIEADGSLTSVHLGHIDPVFGELDHSARVHESEAVARADEQVASILDVVVGGDGLWSRGEHRDVHEVAPRQLRIGLQRQGHDARGDGRGR